MNMQFTYGIFDEEADHLIELVRRHAPLDQIRESNCPACGSAMFVEFADDGTWFSVFCDGKPLHISKCQEISCPPSWWRECVIEPTDSVWYWREAHSFDANGTLTMYISGWDADGVRWSGQLECPSDHPDYAFWKWVLFQSGCASDLISKDELAQLRDRFAKTVEPIEASEPPCD